MMTVAQKPDSLKSVSHYFGEAAAAAVSKRLGESGKLVDFWYDRVLAHPAVFFKFRVGGEEKTEFVRLEK